MYKIVGNGFKKKLLRKYLVILACPDHIGRTNSYIRQLTELRLELVRARSINKILNEALYPEADCEHCRNSGQDCDRCQHAGNRNYFEKVEI